MLTRKSEMKYSPAFFVYRGTEHGRNTRTSNQDNRRSGGKIHWKP